MDKKAYGFTIVELLIVIVVIAILAAISIAAYTNIQQRAKNTAIINAASQSLKMIQAYIAEKGTYPYAPSTAGSACITSTTGCADSSNTINANGTFDTNMATVGTLPRTTQKISGDNRYGVTYNYISSRTMNSQSQPAALLYYLQGTNQQCGMSVTNVYSGDMSMSTSGYTNGNSDGKTACVVSIPGPSV